MIQEKAIIDGEIINFIVRWAKNGRKYVWEKPTQEQANRLIRKYGMDQVCNGVLWLIS